MNTVILLIALIGYVASATVPQMFVKSFMSDVAGSPAVSHLQTPYYQYQNVNPVASPYVYQPFIAPKFQSNPFVGAHAPYVGVQASAPFMSVPTHSSLYRASVPASFTAGSAPAPYIDAAASAQFVGAPVPTQLIGTNAPGQLTGAPVPSYRTENYQTPLGAKSEIRDEAGQYSLSYVSPEGIQVSERSFLKLAPHGDYIPVKEGLYKYISPEGIPVMYAYKADENGFAVQGSPLPVTPSS